MWAIKRWDITGSGILQQLLQKTTLENFRPARYFYEMGEKAMYGDGYNTIAWARFTKLNVSVSTATLTDGVTPLDTAFDATLVTTTPSQYGLVVRFSDMLLKTAGVNFLVGAGKEIGANMGEIIDKVIQTEIMAGDNVTYCSTDHASRATLDTTDLLIATYVNKASVKLKARSVPTFNGYYMAVAHPHAIYDLRSETGTGSWLDAHKYAQPAEIFNGEVGALHGVRFVETALVQTFASGTTVYPTLVFGRGAYGVANLDTLQTYLTLPTATDSDPLAQRASVGAKVAFSAKRLQEDAMERLESGTAFA